MKKDEAIAILEGFARKGTLNRDQIAACVIGAAAIRLQRSPAPEVADTKIHAADEWAEEDGDVLWWRFPIVEPPHLGGPLETDWEDGLYTHWTRFVVPEESSWPK